MGDAKIAAGDVPKFLGKLTYPEKCPFAAALTNNFSLPNATKIFWCPVEIRVCVYYLITVYFVWLYVRLKFIKLHVSTNHISWQFFKLKIRNLQFFKYFWLRLEIRIASITYFSYTKWMCCFLELLLCSSTNLTECVAIRFASEIIESSARAFL
jgi:hypothetical protein